MADIVRHEGGIAGLQALTAGGMQLLPGSATSIAAAPDIGERALRMQQVVEPLEEDVVEEAWKVRGRLPKGRLSLSGPPAATGEEGAAAVSLEGEGCAGVSDWDVARVASISEQDGGYWEYPYGYASTSDSEDEDMKSDEAQQFSRQEVGVTGADAAAANGQELGELSESGAGVKAAGGGGRGKWGVRSWFSMGAPVVAVAAVDQVTLEKEAGINAASVVPVPGQHKSSPFEEDVFAMDGEEGEEEDLDSIEAHPSIGSDLGELGHEHSNGDSGGRNSALGRGVKKVPYVTRHSPQKQQQEDSLLRASNSSQSSSDSRVTTTSSSSPSSEATSTDDSSVSPSAVNGALPFDRVLQPELGQQQQQGMQWHWPHSTSSEQANGGEEEAPAAAPGMEGSSSRQGEPVDIPSSNAVNGHATGAAGVAVAGTQGTPGALRRSSLSRRSVTRQALKGYKVYLAPQVLVLHLKRFHQDDKAKLSKLDTSVKFEFVLDLGPYMAPDSPDVLGTLAGPKAEEAEGCVLDGGSKAGATSSTGEDDRSRGSSMQPGIVAGLGESALPSASLENAPPGASSTGVSVMYDLVGVVVHMGTLKAGHYVSYVKRTVSKSGGDSAESSGGGGLLGALYKSSKSHGGGGGATAAKEQWYYVSDTSVKSVPKSEVEGAQAYMLMYVRRPSG
jgi:hypothetical protein